MRSLQEMHEGTAYKTGHVCPHDGTGGQLDGSG